ncbi:MAG: AroM family protein [Candidatus Methanomethylicaceae archaeon]
MSLRKIGMITIGQSPRVDILPEMKRVLGPQIEVIEAGALDGLTMEEVKKFAPRRGDYILCTRMADGREVTVARRWVIPRIQRCIKDLSKKGAEVLLFLCTGRFPEFPSKKLFIESQRIVDQCLSALQGRYNRMGILVPLANQMEQVRKNYGEKEGKILFQAASPYGPEEELEKAIEKFRKANLQMIVMHCMGYTLSMKKKMMEGTGRPVLLARTLVARVLRELISP